MEKQRIFALISAWPRLDFVAIKIIRGRCDCSGKWCNELYLTDNKEQPSLLFIGKVSEEQAERCIVRLSAWLMEYSHQHGKHAGFSQEKREKPVSDDLRRTLSAADWRLTRMGARI
ncbi:hypothetical protein [Erwinia persicina]|uniref:hypothetical protein n=1 Tax=Erwinia persicina TaxID=55211 RepID=UPI001780BE8B|nr:hypothetical protein [Erwinia persicina]MBD8165082.1 hypothetical protein [Erwinia persicina]